MWGDRLRSPACRGGGDRRALGRGSGVDPVVEATLDIPRTHLRNGDIPGAQREGVRTPGAFGYAGDPTVALRGSHYLVAGPPVRNHVEYRMVPYQPVFASRI